MTDVRDQLMAKLARAFPSGASSERSAEYIDALRGHRFKIRDVKAGIDLVISTREHGTFPPFAVLLAKCNEARQRRLQVERFEEQRRERRRLNPIVSPEVKDDG